MEEKEIRHYNTGYALTLKDLFIKFKWNNLKAAEGMEWLEGLELKEDAFKMFRYFFYLVLDDIIENNVTFKLQKGESAYLEMKSVYGEEFVKARQNGAYLDIDFLASNFTGNHILYRRNTRYGSWCKKIYVGNVLKDRIREYTHLRKQYG